MAPKHFNFLLKSGALKQPELAAGESFVSALDELDDDESRILGDSWGRDDSDSKIVSPGSVPLGDDLDCLFDDYDDSTGGVPSGGESRYSGILPTEDVWSISGEYLFRLHISPRTSMYRPTNDDCPIPLRWLDVERKTETTLENVDENTIIDYWDGTSKSIYELSLPWTGRTRFTFLQLPTGVPGYAYFEGRYTRLEDSSKPERILQNVGGRCLKLPKMLKLLIGEFENH